MEGTFLKVPNLIWFFVILVIVPVLVAEYVVYTKVALAETTLKGVCSQTHLIVTSPTAMPTVTPTASASATPTVKLRIIAPTTPK